MTAAQNWKEYFDTACLVDAWVVRGQSENLCQ